MKNEEAETEKGNLQECTEKKEGVDDRNIGGQGVKNSTFTKALCVRVRCGCLNGENV